MRGIRGRRRGESGARGHFRVEQLVALDHNGKKEARRLGLAGSDDEELRDGGRRAESGDEDADSNDELDQAIKARHRGTRAMRYEDSDESSDGDDRDGFANANGAPGMLFE